MVVASKTAGVDFYVVNEMFATVQGEGVFAGTPATFIRLQGCDVGCPWCDSGPLAEQLGNGLTRNTWGRGGTRMSVAEIMKFVDVQGLQHVVITGGEPVLWDLDGLLQPLRTRGCFTQLETSGRNALKGTLQVDWVTWSPKQRLQWDAPSSIKDAAGEVKWVVDRELPFDRVEETFKYYLAHRGPHNMPRFVLMPEGCPPSSDHVDQALEYLRRACQAFPSWQRMWRFGDRLQYRLGIR